MEEKESSHYLIALRDEDFRAAAARVALPAQRLEWVLMFAQENLDKLSRGRLIDLKLELVAFGYFGDARIEEDMYVATGTETHLRQIQEEFASIITKFLRGEEVDIGKFEVTLRVSRNELGVQRRTEVVDANRGHNIRKRYAQEVFELGLLLGEHGHLVKSCPAPKLRGHEGEVCSRWFIGRPNQTYCSSVCQSRATTRAARDRKLAAS